MDLGWLTGLFSRLQEALTEDLDVDLGDLGVHLHKIDEHVYEFLTPGEITAQGTPSVEFVFFHGLKLDLSSSQETHMITTWISRDKKHCWLLWLLEEFPEARILIMCYDGAVQRTDSQGRTDIFLTSENLIHSLTGDNAHVGRDGCPVVLVGHCLGGLIMKEVCCQAQDTVNITERVESFLANVKGCFFYSTPHQGDLLIDANKNDLNGRLMKELSVLKNTNARRNQKFCQLRHKRHWSTSSVGEGLPVKLKLFEGIVVPEASARLDTDEFYTSTGADHYNVSQPVDKHSGAYLRLRDFARTIVNEKEQTSRREQTQEGPTLSPKWPSLKDEFRTVLQWLTFLGHVGIFVFTFWMMMNQFIKCLLSDHSVNPLLCLAYPQLTMVFVAIPLSFLWSMVAKYACADLVEYTLPTTDGLPCVTLPPAPEETNSEYDVEQPLLNVHSGVHPSYQL